MSTTQAIKTTTIITTPSLSSSSSSCFDSSAYICNYYNSVVTSFCSSYNYISGVSVFTYCAKTCKSC